MERNKTRILEIAQRIYLAKNNRYNDVDGDELDDFIDQTIDWINQFLPELELEADWAYLRANRQSLGKVTTVNAVSLRLPDTVRKLVISPYRDLVILQDGTIVSRFALVRPNQIADPNSFETRDRATVIGRNVILSRPLNEQELGGTVQADVINYIPRVSLRDVEAFDVVDPLQLVVLGVAKNSTLPDIVQGGISNALTQKYTDMLQKAVAENDLSSITDDALVEDFGNIGGVW